MPSTVVKRDGRVESFDKTKVKAAIRKCLVVGLGREEGEVNSLIEHVSKRVCNFLKAANKENPTVEEIQQAVIYQLWSEGESEAAEHYTIYRENRRRQREDKPIPAELIKLIAEDVKHFPTQLQAYQFYSKFSKWRETDKRRETWSECNERVFNWFATLDSYSKLREDETIWLKSMMKELKASPAMRVVQMAGPALERCHVGAYNCAYHPIKDLFAFTELLYILMQGSGNGFSVEADYINRLPQIKKQKKSKKEIPVHVIPDTTIGWCEALHVGLKAWFNGSDLIYDYTLIRKKNTKLKTKGGRASGPEPLKELLNYTREVVLNAQGRRLTDLEVHDICCKTGRIVQVGGVRRAACISLSDLNSQDMRDCKHGAWWNVAKQRSMANNSAVYCYEGLPPVELFMSEFHALVKSKSGERGIFNRTAAQTCKPTRRKKRKFGGNPCLEIILRPFQFCNLSIAVLRGNETEQEILDKVIAATYFGVLQSTATNFLYLRNEWKKNSEEERLTGVDVMGHLDHPLLRPGAAGRVDLVTRMKEAVADKAKELSSRFGINYSAANTCLKPGGDSSVFFNTCTLGGYHSKYQIRRVRETLTSPVSKLLKDQGVPFQIDPVNPELAVFDFYKNNPDNCIVNEDMTAIEQLDNWLFWKKTWAEHSCSVTITVKDHEWPAVQSWVYQEEHFKHLTGVSFLPYDGHSYKATPNERISKDEYDKAMKSFPTIDWSKLIRYEDDDMTESAATPACVAGLCEF